MSAINLTVEISSDNPVAARLDMLDFISLIFGLFELSCIYVGVAGEAAEIELVRERAIIGVRNSAVNMLERHLSDPLGPIK